MGALYVKDDEVRQMAEELAAVCGVTKVAAVKRALANELARMTPRLSLGEKIAELRRTSPLRYDPDVIIDKAFYDSLYDDE
ncbi:type II toxin-antitoxin system VapB family antitoxin [Sphingomonas jeddahensis]|uniref:Rv0623-like transcription factor n=1 Tax=Sphingomonas jeddahensis TaxID=1915074 RepID=A0A1V2EX48_9SPHN|nr:type II toxin-antitoxin system VapB family antitoxin [Sphingomonas jeddahensis]ONF96868.1 Rv0623-like transcription factor [Sphingomonas jeddahensis]